MPPFVDTLVGRFGPAMLLDVAITALFIYWLFSLIRGTRAVTLVIGVSILLGVYGIARALELQLFTLLLETGALVGAFALVVIFQPELRRALERIGRMGSFGWLLSPGEERAVDRVASVVARAAATLSAEGHGALIVIERGTGLEEIAESGVMLHADLSVDLLCTIFWPRTALHDGAVIIRDDRIVAAGALLPLTEMSLQAERYGTRHRAALGITEQTDAVVVVVSEENAQMSLVERARIVRVPTEAQLTRALRALLESGSSTGRLRRTSWGRGPGGPGPGTGLGGGERGSRRGPVLPFRPRPPDEPAADRPEDLHERPDDGPAAAAVQAPR